MHTLQLFLCLLARFSGFFILSPFFSTQKVPLYLRTLIAGACALFLFPSLSQLHLTASPLFFLQLIQELLIGYLMGFLIAILFEAAAFAGQLIGTLTGFSATELLDPHSNLSQPLFARFFSLSLFILFLAADLHHSLLRFLYESFVHFPLDGFFQGDLVPKIVKASGLLFKYALEWSLLPLMLLVPLLAFFAFLSRFFSIFWIGYPLLQMVGLFVILANLIAFLPLLKRGLLQMMELIHGF